MSTTERPAVKAGKVSRRAIWMDVVRGLAIIAVIYGHAAGVGVQEQLFEYSEFLVVTNQVLVLIRMPLLIFLSGMLVPRSIVKGWRHFLPGKFTKLAWPYAVWIALFFVLMWSRDIASLSEIPMNIINPENPDQTVLWYLRNLFFYYLIAQAIVWVRLPLWTGALLGAGISAFQLIEGSAVGTTDLRFANLMMFFFLGAVTMQYREQLSRFFRKPPVAIILVVLWLIPSVIYVQELTAVRYRLEYAWGPLAFIALIIAFAPLLTSTRWTKPLEFIGRYSLYYYVMHYHLFIAYSWWIGSHLDIGRGAHFAILMAIGLIIPTLVVFFSRKVPLIAWAFFELPWPKKKTPAKA